jgi:hypothetical protein
MDYLSAIVELISKAGIAIVAVGSMIYMSWKLLLWGKQIVDTALTQMDKQNTSWQAAVDRSTKALEEHTQSACTFHDRSDEAHKYQREEHQKLISILDEIKLTLVGMNGRKKGK